MSGLLDFLQAASNSVAGNVTGPVDLITLALRKAGVPVPEDSVGTSAWSKQKGLMRDVEPGAARVAGETFGLLGPMLAAQYAPQIAGGLLKAGENLAAPRTLNPQTGAIVWHGSPHKFDKFDSSKIGTGEGAQAYGHGLYLAENPNVATGYADKLSQVSVDGGWSKTPRVATYGSRRVDTMAPSSSLSPGELAVTYANIEGGKANGLLALREMASDPYVKDRERYKKAADILMRLDPKKIGAEYGHLYKVDLPDDAIARMLDWEKPLSQQPEMLSTARAAMHKGPQESLRMDVWARDNPNATGGDLIKQLERLYGVRYANEALGKAGIPGIRYLDGGSRGAGEGTRNYVVFDDSLLTILERNGVPIR